MGALPTRLLGAGLASAITLTVLAGAAVAAKGGASPAAAPPPVPALVRVPGPHPVPEGVAEPVHETPAPPRPKKNRAPSPAIVAAPAPPATTTATEIAAPPLPPPPPPPPAPEIPHGKGMWTWKPGYAEAGNPVMIVARAKGIGLSHIFVRTGSTWDGLQNMDFLDGLLPVAHDAGLKVYGWDFPKLSDTQVDVTRAMDALNHTAPGGHRLDGFAADIETASEGTNFTTPLAAVYGETLRRAAGPSTLLIAVVPNPTPQMLQKYNYDAVTPAFDAIAPMVYWLNREPGADVLRAMEFLSRYRKPLMPVGQAYDGEAEGGRHGVPPPAELDRFMHVASDHGAAAVSFWSWQHVNAEAWDAIKKGPAFPKQ